MMPKYSEATMQNVEETAKSLLHGNWRRAYRGYEIFVKLDNQSRGELRAVSVLCFLLKEMEVAWEIDWVDVMFPNKRDYAGECRDTVTTVFFSAREELNEIPKVSTQVVQEKS